MSHEVLTKFLLTINGSTIEYGGQFFLDEEKRSYIRQFFEAIASPTTQQLQAMAARLNTESTDVKSALDSEAAK